METFVVVSEFEKALLNSIQYQFPESKIVGCYFHFRQALQRKIAKFGIQGGTAELVMEKLSRLITIDARELDAEIERLEHDVEVACPAFSHFIVYFKKTWIRDFLRSCGRMLQETLKIIDPELTIA